MRRTDRHLNIFYSYNRDNELIENNMTRAFIVSMRIISRKLRSHILSKLLKSNVKLELLSRLENIDFALQENIPISVDKLREITNKYIITLTGNNIIEDLEKYSDSKLFDKVQFSPYIKPDAWIFDNEKDPNFCFMIECKTINDVLNAEQIIAYAKYFFGIYNYDEMEKIIIRISWYDIVDICSDLLRDDFLGNEQEALVLENLIGYLSYCNVIPFTGFTFDNIPKFPEYNIAEFLEFNFDRMPEMPIYEFSVFIDFGLERLPKLPSYKIIAEK